MGKRQWNRIPLTKHHLMTNPIKMKVGNNLPSCFHRSQPERGRLNVDTGWDRIQDSLLPWAFSQSLDSESSLWLTCCPSFPAPTSWLCLSPPLVHTPTLEAPCSLGVSGHSCPIGGSVGLLLSKICMGERLRCTTPTPTAAPQLQ